MIVIPLLRKLFADEIVTQSNTAEIETILKAFQISDKSDTSHI